MVFDFKAKIEGRNPYKGYRLKDEFAVKETFKWSDLSEVDIKNNNPFVEIPVEVRKNELFEFLMHFNKNKFVSELNKNRKSIDSSENKGIRNHMYFSALSQLRLH